MKIIALGPDSTYIVQATEKEMLLMAGSDKTKLSIGSSLDVAGAILTFHDLRQDRMRIRQAKSLLDNITGNLDRLHSTTVFQKTTT